MKRYLTLALLLGLAGCAGGPLYEWGSYAQSVDHLATDKDKVNLQEERDTMAKEVAEAATSGKRVPPGKYAYVGYLCYLSKDTVGAKKYFEAEKKAYPESTVFVDRLIARMQ